MKTMPKAIAACVLIVFGTLASGSAMADRGHGRGHGFGGNVRFGISLGFPIYAPAYYPAPYYRYPAYAYPAPAYAYPAPGYYSPPARQSCARSSKAADARAGKPAWRAAGAESRYILKQFVTTSAPRTC